MAYYLLSTLAKDKIKGLVGSKGRVFVDVITATVQRGLLHP